MVAQAQKEKVKKWVKEATDVKMGDASSAEKWLEDQVSRLVATQLARQHISDCLLSDLSAKATFAGIAECKRWPVKEREGEGSPKQAKRI